MSREDIEGLREENATLRARLAELEQAPPVESAAFLRSVLAAVPAFIVHADPELRIRFINRLQPGIELADVLGTSIFDFIAPQDHPVARAAITRARTTGEVVSYTNVGDGPNGRIAHYHVHVAPVRETPEHVGICLVAVDVTDLVTSREALAESQRKLELALRAAKIGLWSWDVAANVVEWDGTMRQMTGRETPADLATYGREIVHPDDRAGVAEGGRRSLETGVFESVPHRIVRPDGSLRWIMTAGTVLTDPSGRALRLIGANVDVTEQRATEEHLRHAQKMKAIGSLTAGVAHNFNNMLGAILPSLELLREVVPESHVPLLEDSVLSAERAAEMIRKLMTFAGQRRSAHERCDVGQLVARVVSMCRRTFDRHIVLEERVDGDVPALSCDAAGLEQALLNLLINARDAVRESGRDRPRIRVLVDASELDGGPAVRIRIEDDGVGLSEAARAHAFEPFFTTKGVGAGTGLGLATSYAIVKEHGGAIGVESERGEGTVVSIRLPVRAHPRVPDRAPVPAAAARRRVVLLVEDEPPVQNVTRRILEHAGHEVLIASNAASAIGMLGRSDIDVVLLDRSLPDVPGTSLVATLRARLPSARLLYYTGQDVDPQERAAVDGVVYKPLRMSELLEAVALEAVALER